MLPLFRCGKFLQYQQTICKQIVLLLLLEGGASSWNFEVYLMAWTMAASLFLASRGSQQHAMQQKNESTSAVGKS